MKWLLQHTFFSTFPALRQMKHTTRRFLCLGSLLLCAVISVYCAEPTDDKASADQETVVPPTGELKALRQENERLKIENELLKKENQQLRQLLLDSSQRTNALATVAKTVSTNGTATASETALTYWLSSSDKRHNQNCRYYQKTVGRPSDSQEGVACKICGG